MSLYNPLGRTLPIDWTHHTAGVTTGSVLNCLATDGGAGDPATKSHHTKRRQ